MKKIILLLFVLTNNIFCMHLPEQFKNISYLAKKLTKCDEDELINELKDIEINLVGAFIDAIIAQTEKNLMEIIIQLSGLLYFIQNVNKKFLTFRKEGIILFLNFQALYMDKFTNKNNFCDFINILSETTKKISQIFKTFS